MQSSPRARLSRSRLTPDLPRRLLHTRIQMPCQPGKLCLWFPKWVPGTHGPLGPVQNVGGLRLETADGKPVHGDRDEIEPYRVECDVPDGVRSIVVRLDVICNEAAVGTAGYLSYGNASVGIINWGTCLMYPEGPSRDDILVHLRLRLPRQWRFATALKPRRPRKQSTTSCFKTVSLGELVDSPLIGGEHLKSIPAGFGSLPAGVPGSRLGIARRLGARPEYRGALQPRRERRPERLFGACHYPEYHFLVTCSDDLGHLGLEHLTSSLNGVHEHDLKDDARRKGWVANLLPHEYVHSWCGKFRRPAGMCTPDFHTPQKTKLLWVYEGLAEYLGEVLMVRSGLVDLKEYREMLALTISTLSHREGRRWRSLEDTAVASHLLRRGNPNWSDLRREQDYYFEGAFDLAGSRRHHPRTFARQAQSRRLLPEVSGQESVHRQGRPLRAAGRS